MTSTLIEFPRTKDKASESLMHNLDYSVSGTTLSVSGQDTGAFSSFGISDRFRTRGSEALQPISIDQLYPASEDSSPQLIRALGLLAEAIHHIEVAKSQVVEDPLAADSDVQALYVLLPELFRCRAIGDGFGTIINSLHFSFINLHGMPLTFDQMATVCRILKALREGPFISFEQALEQVAELEDVQFSVDPAPLADLIEDPRNDE